MSTDRELLELAAKAAGYKKYIAEYLGRRSIVLYDVEVYNEIKERRVTAKKIKHWNPLDDDGDALRLAVKLGLSLDAAGAVTYARWLVLGEPLRRCTWEHHEGDPCAATRRAIVRAAAEIGRAMK